jgi:hypothetical protein
MSYNMMIGYDIYDCFTMEHFRLRQRMTLTTKIYCSRLYLLIFDGEKKDPNFMFRLYCSFQLLSVSLVIQPVHSQTRT